MIDTIVVIFWGSLGFIVYSLIGFPLLLTLRGVFIIKTFKSKKDCFPNISIIIAAYNEEDVIVEKLDNILSSNYPDECLEILVASDGSSDKTNNLVETYPSDKVQLFALPRLGKNEVINQVVQKTSGDIFVFTDADSKLDVDTLKNLIAPFFDPEIGGVCGDYQLMGNKQTQKGERTYWNYDRWLKNKQTKSGSVSGASGALYAVRKKIFSPVPTGVTDDFYTAMQVVSSHFRLIFEPRAITYGPVAANTGIEFKRKIRIVTRGLYGFG